MASRRLRSSGAAAARAGVPSNFRNVRRSLAFMEGLSKREPVTGGALRNERVGGDRDGRVKTLRWRRQSSVTAGKRRLLTARGYAAHATATERSISGRRVALRDRAARPR